MLRKASFKIGLKSILYLFLVFALNGKASNATFTELGCDFANNGYMTDLYYFSNNTAPIWGKKGIDSMELPIDPKDPYWQPIVDYLSQVSVMNDVSPFKKFVMTYKTDHNDDVSLEKFFTYYDFSFKLNETRDPASYIIQMFHKLKNHWRNQPKKPVLQYYYLISASVDPSDLDISIAMSDEHRKRDKLVRQMLQNQVQDHLAGIIKITRGNRTGYILIDPGYANGEKLVQPFVVFLMEDEKYPHKVFMNGFRSNDQIQFTLKQDIPFILAKHTNSNTETKVLYYIGKPYCSFIENTIKMNLLRLNHGIIVRDSANKKQGYLTFKIAPDDNSLILRKTDNTKTGQMKVDKQILSLTNFTKPIDKRIQAITLSPIQMALGISIKEVTTITEDLKYIKTEVYDDERFMTKLIGLSKNHFPKEHAEQPRRLSGKVVTDSLPGKTPKSMPQRIRREMKKCFPPCTSVKFDP